MGERKDTAELLRLMDLSILCSLREGFSNVILESMASGKPVIASNVGGNPEAIVEGATGFLFEPQDSDELAVKTIVLLKNKNLREQMGRTARERAEELFSITKMVEMYKNLYPPLLRTKQITATRAKPVGEEDSSRPTRSSTSLHD